MSLFKWLVFNNSSGSSTQFLFFRLGGSGGRTILRLAVPTAGLRTVGLRRGKGAALGRPQRIEIRASASLATECRLPYPRPFVKRKTQEARHCDASNLAASINDHLCTRDPTCSAVAAATAFRAASASSLVSRSESGSCCCRTRVSKFPAPHHPVACLAPPRRPLCTSPSSAEHHPVACFAPPRRQRRRPPSSEEGSWEKKLPS